MPNLRLAWRRISSGGNRPYKDFFRQLYAAYEVALDDNLRDLQKRFRAGTFQASTPEKIYLPKSSGLHRPLALLHIEDQIILQAFANVAAKKLFPRRERLQLRVVFSNIVQPDNETFFFQRWHRTYAAFQAHVKEHYMSGLRWVADFDVASFYETISHDLLLKTVYPRTPEADLTPIRECLQKWSSGTFSSTHGHGIPQGPLASDFLAECFLLPVDEAMREYSGYLRYVDDVRILGKSESEVREAILTLERYCSERGLIPQAGKFAIRRAMSLRDAVGMVPSLAEPDRESGGEELSPDVARSLFFEALSGRPYRVTDKSRLRYVLFRGGPDARILRVVLRLIPRHPEHVDAFVTFLQRNGYRKSIERLCCDIVQHSPYSYVRGRAWHILTGYLKSRGAVLNRASLVHRAVEVTKPGGPIDFLERLEALQFLLAVEKIGAGSYTRRVRYQRPLLQATVAQELPARAFDRRGMVRAILRDPTFEPGLSICSRLNDCGLGLTDFGLTPNEIPSQVRNTLRELGTITWEGGPVDPIAEVLEKRYGVVTNKSWHTLLKSEYVHAQGLLKRADAAFFSGRSAWLSHHNSFNNLVFLAIQEHLHSTGDAGACATRSHTGERLAFGVMLDPNKPFSKYHPVIAACFRDMNARRNRLPGEHPYDKRSGLRATYLTAQERNKFVNQLRSAFSEIARVMP